MIITNDDSALEYAQVMRKNIVDKITDKQIPDDPQLLNIVLKALDGLASTASSNKRLKIEDSNGNDQKEAQKFLLETMRLINSDKFLIDSATYGASMQPLAQYTDNFVVVDGETDVGVSSETYQSFVKNNEDL